MKLKDFSFRLWNNQEKHYITNNPCLVEFNHNPGEIKAGLLLGEYGNYDFIENYDDEIEIELWTGLCDKNGVKIYENDIVSYTTLQGKTIFYFITTNKNINTFQIFVISDLEKFKLCNEIEIDRFLYSDFSKIEDMKHIEVIGNIHENVELLNENNH